MRVREGATWSPVTAGQQRVVLAVLLAEAGAVVSTERLVAELWGDQPPKEAQSALRGYIMRLRRALGGAAASRLVTRGHGYELLVADGEVDAVVFERSVVAVRWRRVRREQPWNNWTGDSRSGTARRSPTCRPARP
jgi:DNA-binding SARP family transcriptional activator